MDDSRRGALVTLTLVVLVVFASLGLGRFGFSMLLRTMQASLELTTAQSGQLQSWNSLGYLLCVAFAGVLATRYGPSVVICTSLGVIGLAMIGTGLAPGFATVCIARFFSGAGGAAANVPAMALLAAWFSGKRRGLAAGCAVGGSSLGLAATGVSVPLVLAHFGQNGWRTCWIAYGVVTLAVCALCGAFLRNRPREAESAVPGFGKPAAGSWNKVLGSSVLWRVAAAYFAFGFSYSIFATFFPKHLEDGLSLGTRAAGTAWMQIGLVSIVSGFIWGWLSDRWGRRAALTVIFTIQGVAFLTVGLGSGVGSALLAGTLFALTAWSIPAVVCALCGDAFGSRLAPAALGLATVVFGIGQVFGPMVGGILADMSGSLSSSFVVAGCAALVLGAGVSLFLPRPSALTE